MIKSLLIRLSFGFGVLASGCLKAADCEDLVASWYERGHLTANGEVFEPWGLTCAHRSYPFGTFLRVRHGYNSVVVRVNDRGPFHKTRSLDLSRAAFEKLARLNEGLIRVSVEVVPKPK